MRNRAVLAVVLAVAVVASMGVGAAASQYHAGDRPSLDGQDAVLPATADASAPLDDRRVAGERAGTLDRGGAGAEVRRSAGADVPYDEVIDVQLRTNGDARWTVRIYEPLESESDVEAFEDLGERWEAGIADVAFDADLFRNYVERASDATGRSMALPEESVRRVAEVRDGVGVLTLSFTWTNFARQDGDELVVDDAFSSPSGTWLPRLEAGQTLVVRPPRDYVIVDSPPGPGITNQTIRWEGPRTFSETYFQENPIVYRSDRTPTPTPTPSPTPTPTATTPPPEGSDFPRGLLFGILAAVIVGGAMAVYRSTGGDLDVGTDDGGSPESAEPDPDDPFAGVDQELLSDDERVLRLLEANGGRMKQADIVKETDWSNAKVSQLLSSMAEDGEVDKLRIGRENLISLPDVDVEE